MATPHRELFVSLPVRNLKASMAFFGTLGFTSNPQFTDEKAACMVLSDKGYVMLLEDAYFRTFTSREVCDPARASEALVAFSCASHADVDALTDTAMAAGASGILQANIGWTVVNLAALPLMAIVLLAVLWLMQHPELNTAKSNSGP